MKQSILFIDLPIRAGYETVRKEVRLWRAVLDQAISDACLEPQDPTEAVHKARAISFLSLPSDDFDAVCFLANLDRQIVRRVCTRILEED